MKRISAAVLALLVIIALGACTEVPVKQVKKCAKVVDIKMFRSYFLGLLEIGPKIYKILDTGERVRINTKYYYEMEIGRDYCRTEYERVK